MAEPFSRCGTEDDILHTPFKSERTDNYFENRDRLYRNDGPTALGTIGIWEWTAIPNRDNPAIDYVQSWINMSNSDSPVRVESSSYGKVFRTNPIGDNFCKMELLVHKLTFCDTLFAMNLNLLIRGLQIMFAQFAGVLCRANEFRSRTWDRCAKTRIAETVYSLPRSYYGDSLSRRRDIYAVG